MDKCKGNINNFCYVCGNFIATDARKRFKRNARGLSKEFKTAYTKCYKKKVIEKNWAPNSICLLCYKDVLDFGKGIRLFPRFHVPMIWMNPGRKHNRENCYACQNVAKGMNAKKAKSFQYRSVPSAQLPKIRSMDVSLQHEPHQSNLAESGAVSIVSCDSPESDNHSQYSPGPYHAQKGPVLITQARLDSKIFYC